MSSSSSKFCFNPECRETKSESSRKGWRLRSGDFAELCDRCASSYEEGRFCEAFHQKASGWRCCESCGKRVHCGCIVSNHMFILLDAGGVECIACARKNVILATNPVLQPSSMLLSLPTAERFKNLSIKSWSQIAGAGPVPWRQAPSFFITSAPQLEAHMRACHDADSSTGVERFNSSESISLSLLEKKKIDNSSDILLLNHGASEVLENGNGAIKCEEKVNFLSNTRQFSSIKGDPCTPCCGSAVSNTYRTESNGQTVVLGSHSRPAPPPQPEKSLHSTPNNGVDPSGEVQIRNGKLRADSRGKNHFLSRYLPRITDEELQKISVHSNSKITPLFEKMLSASDAGRIGRLVLPKKCAEAYFPPIYHPEGLPLKVQDINGNEWIFQFRFWPNNNSRMYVLEGVTPCIQSMQLQAGDIVTFSRSEPEGKLVMGFRKASSGGSPDQGAEANRCGAGLSAHADAESGDPLAAWSKVDKSGYIAQEVLKTKSFAPRKRKASTFVPKNKRLIIDNMDLLELKITWEEAQGLLRPPPTHLPSVVIIEGFEFEEYEDAPIIGKPTIFATGLAGEKIQWAQCEGCFKWRKLPADALLPSRWTCDKNSYDPERAMCSAAQELTAEELVELKMFTNNSAPPRKIKTPEEDPNNVEALEGLDTLANLAILGEGTTISSSAQATTRHPRHKDGCSCIVCIQPPSGKFPKHKQSCICNVCLTVKRRFRTLMLRRERKQSDKDAETVRKKQQDQPQLAAKSLDDNSLACGILADLSQNMKEVMDDSDDDSVRRKSSTSPFKGQIDLNIQPEREDMSPGSDSGNMVRILLDATKRDLKQQQTLVSNNSSNEHLAIDQTPHVSGGIDEIAISNNGHFGANSQEADMAYPSSIPGNASASSPAIG